MLKLSGTLKNYIWGGEKLKSLYGRTAEGIVAESWEVSVHPDGQSKTETGTLSQYLQEHPFAVDKQGSALPVLIKFIDAAQKLSVQVHPDDEYAQANANDNGKTEMWYIIQADEGAGIYCGFRHNTSREEFLQHLSCGTVEELLNFIPVKAGDAYLIKAGTVHAIGAGCLICEVQQNSNVTYRVFDYNRLGNDGKPRPLHVEKALEVMNFNAYKDETGTQTLEESVQFTLRLLTECEYFSCRELTVSGRYENQNHRSFTAINVINGNGTINGLPFASGDSFFVDCCEKFEIIGNAVVLLTTH